MKEKIEELKMKRAEIIRAHKQAMKLFSALPPEQIRAMREMAATKLAKVLIELSELNENMFLTMETNNQVATRPVPKVEDLYNDKELSAQHNDLNKLLNCEPNLKWIRVNKYANNSKYIPIGIIEYLLTSIFIKWRVEIKDRCVMANSVVVTVRVHVLDPVTGEWDWQDGIGASPIQTAAGEAATDFSKVTNNAVQMAAPAAEAYAFKDACEKFGKLFGKDINRKDENQVTNYQPTLDSKFKEVLELPEELVDAISLSDQQNLVNIYQSNKEYHNNLKFMQLLEKRKQLINETNPAQQ